MFLNSANVKKITSSTGIAPCRMLYESIWIFPGNVLVLASSGIVYSYLISMMNCERGEHGDDHLAFCVMT